MSLTEKRKMDYQKRLHGNLDWNTNEIEPKLDSIIANTTHSVFCQELINRSINGGSTIYNAVLDIGVTDGPYTVQIAGDETHALNYTLHVSSDNITYYPYPLVVTNLNGYISSTFTMTFRYSYLGISNTTGTAQTVNIIQCARH